MTQATIIQGDARSLPLASESVDCCVTSPPYWGLRDYGTDAQLGLEKTPEEYVANMVDVFREVRRVLKPDGTLWLNLGDSYAGSWGNQGRKAERGTQRAVNGPMIQNVGEVTHATDCDMGDDCSCGASVGGVYPGSKKTKTGSWVNDHPTLKPKDLVGIPWRVAFALQADGWWLRQDIIWHKPNPMPESVTDRCTKAHEYVFLLTKSARYRYDAEAVKEAASGLAPGNKPGQHKTEKASLTGSRHRTAANLSKIGAVEKRNRRSVWTIPTKPYSGAHFAVMPEALAEPCILAGCPEGGTVLDPFAGSGTVGRVAIRHRRNAMLIETNPEYIALAKQRVVGVQVGLPL